LDTKVAIDRAVDVIQLCEAGRDRDGATLTKGLPKSPESLLALGMVETARGNLELGKNYFTRALNDLTGDLAEKAGVQLAVAYSLGGETHEALALLEGKQSVEGLIARAVIETTSDPEQALQTLALASKFSISPGMEGRLHNQRAIALRKLGELDRAVVEYDAAIYCFKQAHSDCLPLVLNNLAGVYLDCGEYSLAHQQVDRAIELLEDDFPHLGKAYDQKANIFLAEKSSEAEIHASRAVLLLEQGDKREWLIEALITYAKTLIQADKHVEAFTELEKARRICNYLGRNDLLLTVVKAQKDVCEILLRRSDISLIELALKEANGSFRRAAKKLGITHRALIQAIERYGLARKPKRLKSVMR